MKKLVLLFLAVTIIITGCQTKLIDSPDTSMNQDGNVSSMSSDQVIRDDIQLTFSHEAGVYNEAFNLEMVTGLGFIYYTTDGSDPRDSDSRVLYDEAILIDDRSHADNIIANVNPVLFSGNFNTPKEDRQEFVSTISPPSNSAVDKCTTIRAVVEMEDGSYSQVISATYFIGTPEEHIQGLAESVSAAGQDLAVISITMNYDDLFDSETGIYVKGDIFEDALTAYLNEKIINNGEIARSLDANYKQKGSDWERACHMELFEFNSQGSALRLSQDCGIRIQGNYSRSDLQKGFRLRADNDYGDNNFRYPIFGDDLVDSEGETIDKFKKLILRAGGNCAFTAKFNDAYWQSMVEELNCDTKASRPCVVYLNGEYFGLYVLEEDYDNDYFEDHYGVDKEDVIIYKGDAETYEVGYKLDEGELPKGVSDVSYYFNDLITFINAHQDLTNPEDYHAFLEFVDVESLRDYFAAQIWINNKWDWPGKNWSIWRTTEIDPDNPYADGRWRFMFYDMEFGGVSGRSDVSTNTIKEDNYEEYGLLDMSTDNPVVFSFAYLMTNEDFRDDFLATLDQLSSTIFKKEKALGQLDYFESVYGPLYHQFYERYPGTGSAEDAISGGYASSGCIRAFLEERHLYIQTMIDWTRNHFN